MAKKPTPKTARTVSQSSASKWGGQTKQVHVPSGVKLIMDEDSDCILCYIGSKDISDKLGKEAGEVVYQTFHDGRRLVSMPNSYALTETQFEPFKFYYLHVTGLVQNATSGFNPMKDFEIVELGSENEEIASDENRTGTPSITLTLDSIADLNYNRLNYPLRKNVVPKA
jgi:hypothetical protein